MKKNKIKDNVLIALTVIALLTLSVAVLMWPLIKLIAVIKFIFS
jgi:hypothetical protein